MRAELLDTGNRWSPGAGGGILSFPFSFVWRSLALQNFDARLFSEKKRLRQSSSPPQCDQKLICPVGQVASVFFTIATNSSFRRVLAPGLRLRLGALSPKKIKQKQIKCLFSIFVGQKHSSAACFPKWKHQSVSSLHWEPTLKLSFLAAHNRCRSLGVGHGSVCVGDCAVCES